MSEISPPLLTVDSSHHGAWVVIAGAVGLAVTFVCLLIRIYVRVAVSPPFGTDDGFLFVASFFTFVQSIVMFSAVDRGYGTHIDLLDKDALFELQKMVYAGDMLYLIALYLTKCCIGTIFLRLTPIKGHKIATWATIGLCTVWVVAAMFMISINCQLVTPWEMLGANCPSLFVRWQVIGAVDVVTEGCLFGLAIYLLAGLQMPMSKKWIVLFTFGARLPLIAFTIVRISHLDTALRSTNPSLDLVQSSCWTQAALNYSLIACTSFCLKPFMTAVNTNYGNADNTSASNSRYPYAYGYGYSGATRPDTDSGALDTISGSRTRSQFKRLRDSRTYPGDSSFALTSMGGGVGGGGGGGKGDSDEDDDNDSQGTRTPPIFRGENPGSNRATARANEDRRTDADSVGSSDSTKMIIKKDVSYTIQYETRGSRGSLGQGG